MKNILEQREKGDFFFIFQEPFLKIHKKTHKIKVGISLTDILNKRLCESLVGASWGKAFNI